MRTSATNAASSRARSAATTSASAIGAVAFALLLDIDAQRLEAKVAQAIEEPVETGGRDGPGEDGLSGTPVQRHLGERGAEPVADPAPDDDPALSRAGARALRILHGADRPSPRRDASSPAGHFTPGEQRRLEETEAAGPGDRFVARVHAELAVDAPGVGLDGVE